MSVQANAERGGNECGRAVRTCICELSRTFWRALARRINIFTRQSAFVRPSVRSFVKRFLARFACKAGAATGCRMQSTIVTKRHFSATRA